MPGAEPRSCFPAFLCITWDLEEHKLTKGTVTHTVPVHSVTFPTCFPCPKGLDHVLPCVRTKDSRESCWSGDLLLEMEFLSWHLKN